MRFRCKIFAPTRKFENNFFIALFLFCFCLNAQRVFAKEMIFPKSITSRYDSSLSAVESGNIDGFRDSVIELKNELYRHGLLSINSFVDDALSRSFALERNVRLDIVRSALQVSPLNVKYWLYLGLNDLLAFNLYSFWDDIVNLYHATLINPVPLLKSTYIVFGYFVMFHLFFTFFFSIAIMMKYFPSLVSDVLRIKPLQKVKLIVAPLIIGLIFTFAYVIRAPFALLFFILVIFSPYMVKRELLLTFCVGFVIVAGIFFNGKMSFYTQMAISPERKNLLHLVYGIATGVRDVDIEFEGDSLVSSAGKLRYAFLRGEFDDSVSMAADLEKKVGDEYGVIASMGKFYQGDVEGAIIKMTEVLKKREKDPIVLFNLYQLYITDYRFDQAAGIQEKAWENLAMHRPFQINPKKIGERILVPPSISGNYFKVFMEDFGTTWHKELPFRNLWLNPLGGSTAYFVILMAALVILRVITYNRYLILACRICGDRQLWKVGFKKEDICQFCKSKAFLVKGIAGILEKSYQIKIHKRAVRIKSLIVPGFGFLSVGSLSVFFLINILISLFLSLFVLFNFSFPGDYSPLYAVISRLGTLFTGALVLVFYIFSLISNELLLRRMHRKYKISTV
jgi:hypothetical protein